MTNSSHAHDELEDHDLGLSHDVPQLVAQQRPCAHCPLAH